jgi:acetate kinase
VLAESSAILVLNGGSSSIRFALARADAHVTRLRKGKLHDVGGRDAHLLLDAIDGQPPSRVDIEARDHAQAIAGLVDWLADQADLPPIAAVGHRVVHGMHHFDPERITPALLEELKRILPVDPDHLPVELAMIQAMSGCRADVPQVACFDTLFHRDLPRIAAMLPIPRRYEAQGVRRYGFHGLSYTWLMERLCAADAGAARARVVLAHLGGGASLAAVRDGHCIDTTMSFTPTAGLMMGTRCGDLDPALGPYLQRTAGLDGKQFLDMISHESGLLGVSERSADMRELLAHEAHDERAAEAVALFCYQAAKSIGGLAAALDGLQTLVFSGGIGETSAVVRARICERLRFLGLELDPARNEAGADVISTSASRVTVRVIPTDEEHVIARAVRDVLATEPTP